MVYSFDIFDTLITRTTAEPKGIFLIMQEVMTQNKKYVKEYPYVIKHFAEYRISAEQEARRQASRNGIEEVCLYDIYTVLQRTCGIEDAIIREWMILEQETEFKNIIPVRKNIEILKEYTANNKVLLISDMYLSAECIRKMLCKFDSVFEKIPLFVSCELLKTKRNGTLYEHIIAQENIELEQWLHVGDNRHSDGVVVERMGGKSVLESVCELRQRDCLFLRDNSFELGYQLTLGAIKCVRLQNGTETLSGKMGLEVAAPILYGYVLWVLEKAIELGKRNLFFIARDGYLLKEIADRIISFRKWKINTHYIYGSRKVWRTPYLLRESEVAKEWFFDNYGWYNLDELASESGVKKEELMCWLPERLVKSDSPCESVNGKNRMNMFLAENDEIWKFIADRARENCDLTKEYIKQEIQGKKDIAFVEFNGTGKSFICLSELLKEELELPVISFYYSMFNVPDFLKTSNLFYQFSYQYLDPGVCLLEHFARAPHGQTQGYKLVGGKYVPILGEAYVGMDSKEDWQAYMDAITAFTEKMENQESVRYVDFAKVSQHYIQYANKFEDTDLQQYIGDMYFSSKACKDGKVIFAPVITDEVLDKMRACQYRGEWRKYYHGEHLDFSIKRMPLEKQKLIKQMLAEDMKKPVAFPDYLKAGGKVVLYGAGKYGKRIYDEYQNNHYGEVVLWVDKNCEMLNDEKIVSPSVIESAEYDYVVIGILNYDIYCEVFRYLIGLGVLPEKII